MNLAALRLQTDFAGGRITTSGRIDLLAVDEKGEITPQEYYQEIAATAMGTMVTAGLIGMAKAGFITGSCSSTRRAAALSLCCGRKSK